MHRQRTLSVETGPYLLSTELSFVNQTLNAAGFGDLAIDALATVIAKLIITSTDQSFGLFKCRSRAVATVSEYCPIRIPTHYFIILTIPSHVLLFPSIEQYIE